MVSFELYLLLSGKLLYCMVSFELYLLLSEKLLYCMVSFGLDLLLVEKLVIWHGLLGVRATAGWKTLFSFNLCLFLGEKHCYMIWFWSRICSLVQ